MNRRHFLAISTLAIALPAAFPAAAEDAKRVEYTRQLYDQLLASGEPFMLDFYASW